MRNVPAFRCAGYTLLELLIVIVLLALIAAVAVPAITSSDDERLALATEEFAMAMRYARSETIRTGLPHGFRQQNTQRRVNVFTLDTSSSPATMVFDVRHPISKQIYEFDLDAQPLAEADTITRSTIFSGTCNQHGRIYFDTNGTPWCADPANVLLRHYEIHLYFGSHHRQITLDGITGRVTTQ